MWREDFNKHRKDLTAEIIEVNYGFLCIFSVKMT